MVQPPRQIDQPSADNHVNPLDRAIFRILHERPTLGIVENRRRTGSLAVQEAIGAARVERDHPVAHDRKRYAPDPGGRAPTTAVGNLCQFQKLLRLVRALRPSRQSPQSSTIKIIPQADRRIYHKAFTTGHRGIRLGAVWEAPP